MGSDTQKKTSRPGVHLALAVLLACASAAIGLTIELCNVQLGGLLPRPGADTTKWRVRMPSHVRKAFIARIRSESQTTTEPVKLTETQSARLQEELQRARRNNDLHSIVSRYGLLQYLLAPLALMVSAAGILRPGNRKREQIGFGLAAAVAAGCVVLMLHRDYLGSLGW